MRKEFYEQLISILRNDELSGVDAKRDLFNLALSEAERGYRVDDTDLQGFSINDLDKLTIIE